MSGRERGGPATAPSARELGVRLLVFAAFAAYACAHWARLVAGVPAGRVVAIVAIAITGAAVLGLLERAPASHRAKLAAAAAVTLAMAVLGAIAAGIGPQMLLPGGWERLVAELDHALLGIQGIDWPYDGPDGWVRATILLGAPLLLAIAAALGFWPATPEARPPLRACALIVLLVAYGFAATTRDPGDALVRGLVLLALIAAWLWLPRLPARDTAAGLAGVALAAVLALPAAAALDGDRPWFDYRSWNPFGDAAGVTFDWTHEYGPLDWPRQGTTLLKVESDRPHYWKAQTLDYFDGVRWVHTAAAEQLEIDAEMPFADQAPEDTAAPWEYGRFNPEWDHSEIRFTVTSLSTELVVGAGLTYAVGGIAAEPAADGTTDLIGPPLERGTTYVAQVYEPDPDRFQMTGAPSGYDELLSRYTAIRLPPTASDPTGQTTFVPLRGNRADPDDAVRTASELRASPYDRMYYLALSVTSATTTVYGAVKAIEGHLQESYRYSERVPESPFPLASFLFEDRRGYCQQFSGTMALMLRMLGIPARVAAGFSPGTLNRRTGEYRVRDLDAHSWVEVYFNGIGWVPFDPTPSEAPAESQSNGALATSAAAADAGEVRETESEPRPSPEEAPDETAATESEGEGEGATAAAGADGGGGGPAWLAPPLAIGLLAIGLAIVASVRVRRRDALGPRELVDAQLAELRRALALLGWESSHATTLTSVARELDAATRPAAASYARALGRFRYGPGATSGPDVSARRAVRRELGAGGLRRRLRALRALPPGGPAPG